MSSLSEAIIAVLLPFAQMFSRAVVCRADPNRGQQDRRTPLVASDHC